MNPIEYPTARWARELPDHPAVIVGQSVVSYRELEHSVVSTATNLRERGVASGERVIVCAANSFEWIVVAHALARLGAVLVPLSTRAHSSQMQPYQRTYTPCLTLVGSDTTKLWGNTTLMSVCKSESAPVHNHIPIEIEPDRLFSVVQTSGSEGEPKGVCLSFRNHLASALASALNLGAQPDDRWLLNLSLDRIGGLAIMMRAAIYGTTVVVHDRFDAEATWQSMCMDRITQLSLVATTLRRLLDAAPDQSCPEYVRTVMVGGGPVPASLIDEARDRGFPILPTYGLTETSSQIATLSPVAPKSKRHTAGTPLALAEIEIRDDENHALPVGSEGRIHVRGPMVAESYWSGDGPPEGILDSDGWFRTNDIGSLDADGYLTVHGRIDNVINSGGEKIHAEEIENALALHESIAQAVVIGIDDPEWGQTPIALIVTKPCIRLDEVEIFEFLKGRLARHKCPRKIEIVDEIPTLQSGKPDRQAARLRHRT